MNRNFLFLCLLFFYAHAYGYPEMIRHGYVNCTSCHISPTGGGLLNEYGTSMRKEVLSTWSQENEDKTLHGLYSEENWLKIGGHIRAIQTFLENESVKKAAFFPMQMEVDLGAVEPKWSAVVSAAAVGGKENRKYRGQFDSPTHYFIWHFSDETGVRAGRFKPHFGINHPSHMIYTRSDIDMGLSAETYAIEMSLLNEKFEAFITGLAGGAERFGITPEKGAAFSTGGQVFETVKLGISALSGERDTYKRKIFGLYMIAGIAEKFAFLGELDYQLRTENSIDAIETKGLFSYLKAASEVTKGVLLYGFFEHSQTNIEKSYTLKEGFGPGIQFNPRPHFELNAEYLKERNLSIQKSYYDVGWLMLHYSI